ncbi:carboxynorspermidine decarboxylase [Helicobacter didelphidarum]|uniref:Carboxynorspermidine/carboxyspermidine decarboxylase n=1 Tax=Helicobacter didelphidarum TaxID=2040648 RepID=A0A3D8IPB4_9HELI|nr:carboxynorspermidine decarboxylase [Helicobacter didelphidarum]RDU67137.1 carboxynorspermidine decarboxylase [Helicobacter didelphidarum]
MDTTQTDSQQFSIHKIFLQDELNTHNIISEIPSPCYVLCYESLESNLQTLHYVARESEAKILVALKGYSFWREFSGVRKYLNGATCSGVNEARLAYEEITLKAQNPLGKYNNIFPSQQDLAKDSHKYIKESPENIYLQSQNNYKEICVFSPSYKESQMREIVQYATHIIFNSFGQWEKFYGIIEEKNKEIREHLKQKKYNNIQKYQDSVSVNSNKDTQYAQELYESDKVYKQDDLQHIATPSIPNKIIMQQKEIQVGLRINPLYSEVSPPIYNPCIPKSRLGIIPSEFIKNLEFFATKENISTIEFFTKYFSGLHFHTHCEQDSSSLQRTLPHVIEHFHHYIQVCKWINFGGGHHITRKDYNIELLIDIIKDFKQKYHDIEVFLEPGEAVGWQVGDLIGEVVDIIENDGRVAILDISASCHMPDCLEMPYRPECYKISFMQENDNQAQVPEIANSPQIEKQTYQIEKDLGENIGTYQYRFGGSTCLAGDIIGDYSFNTPLHIGDRIAFCDMIHYTIVKNTTFNGIELPSLGVVKNHSFKLLKKFSYFDFKERN